MLLPLQMLNLLKGGAAPAVVTYVYGGSITAPFPLSIRGGQAISGQVVEGSIDGALLAGGRTKQAISGQVMGGTIDGAASFGGRVEAVN